MVNDDPADRTTDRRQNAEGAVSLPRHEKPIHPMRCREGGREGGRGPHTDMGNRKEGRKKQRIEGRMPQSCLAEHRQMT